MTIEESEPYTVLVDREMCQTAAVCLAYSIYELDDESKAVLLTNNGKNSDDPGNLQADEGEVLIDDLLNADSVGLQEMQDLVMESARACPFNAIIVKDKQGKQLWPLE